ncbi:MAG: hypothetical protein ACOCWE_06250 [Bacillota bacterium]
MRSVIGAIQALEELAKLISNQAHKIADGDTKTIKIKKLNKGD